MPPTARTPAPAIMAIVPQSVPVSLGAGAGAVLVEGRATSFASGERRSCPVFATASRASGERRSWLAALATGVTTAVARTAARMATILRVLRLIEPSFGVEPPGAARRG